MQGISLSKPIEYLYASFCYFDENQSHLSGIYKWNVLILVYEGVLRFNEDGIDYEIHPGEYFIQPQGSVQMGKQASDTPKYLYFHFYAEWGNGNDILPKSGKFNYAEMKELMEEANTFSYENALMTEKNINFNTILNRLYRGNTRRSVEQQIADRIKAACGSDITLKMLCDEFHFSKNHLIRRFVKEFGVTPIEYLNTARIERAEYLLVVTSYSAELVAEKSGYNSYSHFYRQFCRKNGISPIEWRKQRRIIPEEQQTTANKIAEPELPNFD